MSRAQPWASFTLRYIAWPADLRRTEETLMATMLDAEFVASLARRDTVAFVSSLGNQIRFTFRPLVLGETRGSSLYASRARVAWTSVRARLNVGEFNPERIADYADEAGIHLLGLQRFHERYAHLKEQR